MKVKVCGLRREGDVRLAVEVGADCLGFIFYSKSPRFILPSEVRKIVERLKIHSPVEVCGVFVDADPQVIAKTATEAGLTCIQFHGNEPASLCETVKLLVPEIRLIKAVRAKSAADLERLTGYGICDGFLIDSFVEGLYGGTGKVSDWDLAIRAKKFGPVFLSGGLTSENVSEAIASVKPFGVDVSSGVENEPGVKSESKMRKFFEQVRKIS